MISIVMLLLLSLAAGATEPGTNVQMLAIRMELRMPAFETLKPKSAGFAADSCQQRARSSACKAQSQKVSAVMLSSAGF